MIISFRWPLSFSLVPRRDHCLGVCERRGSVQVTGDEPRIFVDIDCVEYGEPVGVSVTRVVLRFTVYSS